MAGRLAARQFLVPDDKEAERVLHGENFFHGLIVDKYHVLSIPLSARGVLLIIGAFPIGR